MPAITFTANSEQLVAATKKSSEEILKLGADAKSVFSGLGTDQAASAMAELANAFAKADAAVKKIDTAPITRIGTAVAGADVRLQDLTAAIEKARAAGVKIGPDVEASFAKMNAALVTGTQRAGQVADTMERVKLGTQSAKDKIDLLSGSTGSLSGIFNAMRDSADKNTVSIGKMGGGIIVANQLFGVMKGVADGTKATIDFLTNAYDKHQGRLIDINQKSRDLMLTNVLVKDGLVKLGATQQEQAKALALHAVAIGGASKAQREFVTALSDTKVPPTFDQITDRVRAMESEIKGAERAGPAYAAAYVNANKEIMLATAAMGDEFGVKLPPKVALAVRALREMGEAQLVASKGIKDYALGLDPLDVKLRQSIKDYDALREAVIKNGGSAQAFNDGVKSNIAALATWATSLDSTKGKLKQIDPVMEDAAKRIAAIAIAEGAVSAAMDNTISKIAASGAAAIKAANDRRMAAQLAADAEVKSSRDSVAAAEDKMQKELKAFKTEEEDASDYYAEKRRLLKEFEEVQTKAYAEEQKALKEKGIAFAAAAAGETEALQGVAKQYDTSVPKVTEYASQQFKVTEAMKGATNQTADLEKVALLATGAEVKQTAAMNDAAAPLGAVATAAKGLADQQSNLKTEVSLTTEELEAHMKQCRLNEIQYMNTAKAAHDCAIAIAQVHAASQGDIIGANESGGEAPIY